MRKQNRSGNVTFILVLIVTVILHGEASGQQRDTEKPKNAILSTYVVIRDDGWNVPAARKRPGAKAYFKTIEGIRVDVIPLIPLIRIAEFEDYFIVPDKELRISHGKRKIDSISALSIRGRIFAYGVIYRAYHGIDSDTGAMLSVYYLDRDGDGRFEERISSIVFPSLPEWVKH